MASETERIAARGIGSSYMLANQIGDVFSYDYHGKQYVGVYSGIGGWAGIGLAAGLTEGTAGLGAVGGYSALARYTTLGGSLFVFALPDSLIHTAMQGESEGN
jgi:glucose dehydrogenase